MNFCQAPLPAVLLAALYGMLQHCNLPRKEKLLQVMCSQAACLLLQSKTAEHKEHFGTYQDPRSKNEWEKAGDLRYGHHTHFRFAVVCVLHQVHHFMISVSQIEMHLNFT